MITKTLNFTCVTGRLLKKNESPGKLPFDPEYNTEHFIFTVPRKLSFDAAVREARKRYTMDAVIKDSIFVDYEQREYQISIDDFIKSAEFVRLVK